MANESQMTDHGSDEPVASDPEADGETRRRRTPAVYRAMPESEPEAWA